MRAVLLSQQMPVEDSPLALREVDEPQAGAGEVRVKVSGCEVCRTDIHIAEGDLPLHANPLIHTKRLTDERIQRGPKFSRFAGVALPRGLHQEKSDDNENKSTCREAELRRPVDPVPLRRGRPVQFEIRTVGTIRRAHPLGNAGYPDGYPGRNDKPLPERRTHQLRRPSLSS